ncbi:MAG TPA: hypothetical protein VHK88_14205 [Aquihabitans sp.]|jgi:hypothetical protein|nr:hypothetical protein [Aquihabitans sp.]
MPDDLDPASSPEPSSAARVTGATALADPTLDPDRGADLRAFLVREAAADTARPTAAAGRSTPRRRLAAGMVLALALAGGIVAVDAVTGGSGSSRSAEAVAITEEGAWTTIRIVDQDADPDDVMAQLEAGGIPALRRTIRIGRASDGSPTVRPEDMAPVGDPAGQGATVFVVPQEPPGERGLVALSVTRTGADLDTSRDRTAEEIRDEAQRDWAANGARLLADGSVSIREGSGNTVVVYTAA